MPLNQNEQPDIKYHDRLDQMLHTENYSDAVCGSPHPKNGNLTYCCPDCPTLKAKIREELAKEGK